MSPQVKEIYSHYLPQDETDFTREISRATEADLDSMSAWARRKIQNTLVEHFLQRTEIEVDEYTSIVTNILDEELERDAQEWNKRSDQIEQASQKTDPANGSTDYTIRDVDRLIDRCNVLWQKDTIIYALLDDKENIRRYTERLVDECRTAAYEEVLDVVGAKDRDARVMIEQLEEVINILTTQLLEHEFQEESVTVA